MWIWDFGQSNTSERLPGKVAVDIDDASIVPR